MKRFPLRSVAFRTGLACGMFLLFSSGLHAQEAPAVAVQQAEIASSSAGGENRIDANASKIDAVPQSQDDPQPVNVPTQLTFHARFKIYAHSVTSPVSLIGPAVGAGFGQLNNSPDQWGQGMRGYGRRFGSGVARNTIANTIAFSVAAIDHEDPRFMPSHESSILKRATHTVAGTFVTHTDRGDRIPAYSNFIAFYGASFIANSWYPESKRTFGGGMQRGTTALLSSVAWRLLQEFGPDVWGRLHHRRD